MTTDATICPFMSRSTRWNQEDQRFFIAEVTCLRERCAAWNPKYPDCRLIWGP